MISWPGFQLQSTEYFITCKQAGKQALSRLTGAPSLITNMWKYVFRSKISGLPWRLCQSSVVLSANMQTNTCIKGHMLPCKYYMLTREDRITFTCVCKTCIVVIRACVSVFLCTLKFSPWNLWGWPSKTGSMEHLPTLKTKESLGNALVIHHLFSLA